MGLKSNLVLVRHGQSEWNEKNLFTGWKDPGLTELGYEEAKKAGNYKLADQIRGDLNKEGIDIKDEKGKTTWSYK